MLLAYTLRPPYRETLVGGVVTTGQDGALLDIKQTLEDNDGEIRTDDNVLQAVLDNYHGADGLVFEASVVEDDGSRTALKPAEPIVPQMPDLSGAQVDSSGHAASAAPAREEPADGAPVHPESGYSGLTDDELKQLLDERKLPYDEDDDSDTLIDTLEAHDEEEAARNA